MAEAGCVEVSLGFEKSDIVFAMCDQWFRGSKGERVPIDESCQLWVPIAFDPATETAKILPVEQFSPLTQP